MHLTHFDFELPETLIAQHPPNSREDSRLMVLSRREKEIRAGMFPDILDYFAAGDLLVLNDTRVIPARLLGEKESGGRIEVFLVRRLASHEEDWACLTRCSKTPKAGARLLLGGEIEGTLLAGGEAPYRHIRFRCQGDFTQVLERVGRIPLPPYIRREDDQLDRDRYQTVFAITNGAVAAPTAGLHFTERILEGLRSRGVTICPLTLHVGLGTFLPVRVENILEHRMHVETYHIPRTTADAVNRAKAEGRRVFALGTTTTRTLEHAVDETGCLKAGEGNSDLFIYPGFKFRMVDAMITNFHLPKSTLLMLVSGFAGRDFILEAYRRAVRERFRFFSYGDCMLIL
ncbi:MAG: tRNA preQ1(34) S-adenosylmethionine ribosyltransferase-isomerase QueA [Desulfuromonadaceae bacterium GWC2_58_13]|nr:MAG: tRNA preQ1(34) S-adenosylmethionine ribosyltransferase-isomerase QueA [Desulfuromonadaceae bacterium GWC2_58_13]